MPFEEVKEKSTALSLSWMPLRMRVLLVLVPPVWPSPDQGMFELLMTTLMPSMVVLTLRVCRVASLYPQATKSCTSSFSSRIATQPREPVFCQGREPIPPVFSV